MNVTFKTNHIDSFKIIDMEIASGSTNPEEFATALEASKQEFVGPFVMLLGGRGPVWGYGMMMHETHASKAVATLDPRIGYVVVQSHDANYKVGQIIPVPLIEG